MGRTIESTHVSSHLTDRHKAFAVFQLVHSKLQEESTSRKIEKYKDRADYIQRAVRDHKNQVLGAEDKRKHSGGIHEVNEAKKEDESWAEAEWGAAVYAMGYAVPSSDLSGEDWSNIIYAMNAKGKCKGGGKMGGWWNSPKGGYKGKGKDSPKGRGT